MVGKLIEVRGGAVAFEQGAVGGNFEGTWVGRWVGGWVDRVGGSFHCSSHAHVHTGVIFLSVANTPESVASAIQLTLEGVGGRVYGTSTPSSSLPPTHPPNHPPTQADSSSWPAAPSPFSTVTSGLQPSSSL